MIIKKYTYVYFLSFLTLTFFPHSLCIAGDLQKYKNVIYIDNPSNDGDSFHIKTEDKELHIRLYYVDCPEISVMAESDARQVREQTRYFGLNNYIQTVYYGEEAKKTVKQLLSKPFTIYTSHASALGRSAKGRIYAFVITHENDDLACLLVKKGLARIHGVGRMTPDNIPRDEMFEKLKDYETSAILKRAGVWKESDPDHIATFREEQRKEEKKLKEIKTQINQSQQVPKLIDINTANKEELESIPGIGPVLAQRIIDGRPYKLVDELLKIKGIGRKSLERFRNYFIIMK